jgi:cytochrome c biogenesis protein CcmG/thiol:disulfide interchange protein DsbE
MPEIEGLPELDARPQSRREWSGYLRSLVLPLGLVVAIAGGLLFLQSRGGGGSEPDGFGTVELPAAKNATAKAASSAQDRAAPDFYLRSLAGEPLRLSDLQGKPVLVNFWAAWCTTCRAETPDLIKAYQQYKADGLVIVGVNLREADTRVKDFVDEFGMPYPIVFDRSGEVARTWRIGGPSQGLPSSYFIDRQGVVRKVVYGSVTSKLMDEGLKLIMGSGN